MEDDFDVPNCLVDDVITPQVTFDELDLILKWTKVFPLARGEVVENTDGMPTLQKGLREIGSNESCATGDQAVHIVSSLKGGSYAVCYTDSNLKIRSLTCQAYCV